MLVAQATELGYRSFCRALAYWSQLADPEGSERSAERQHADRGLHLSQSFAGSWMLNGCFDPINGAVIANVGERIETELFQADWAEAKERVGDAVCAGDLARSQASAGPMPWWRWPGGRRPCPRGPGCPSRCSACWWAMRPSQGAPVSWPTERWSLPGLW